MKKLNLKQKKKIKDTLKKILNIFCYCCTALLILFGVLASVSSCDKKEQENNTANIALVHNDQTNSTQHTQFNNSVSMPIGYYTWDYIYEDNDFHIIVSGTYSDSIAYSFGFRFDDNNFTANAGNYFEFYTEDEDLDHELEYYYRTSATSNFHYVPTLLDFTLYICKANVYLQTAKTNTTSLNSFNTNYGFTLPTFDSLWNIPNIKYDTDKGDYISRTLYSGFYYVYAGGKGGWADTFYVYYRKTKTFDGYSYVADYYDFGYIDHFIYNVNIDMPTPTRRISSILVHGNGNSEAIFQDRQSYGNKIFLDLINVSAWYSVADGINIDNGVVGNPNATIDIFSQVFTLLSSAFGVLIPLFMLEIAPGFYLGTLILIPLVVILIVIIVKIAMKSGA